MVESIYFLTKTETLLDSNMLGTLILSYVFLLFILFVSFLNIYSVDKNEFLYNKQKCFEFKHKMRFIIMYSKVKNIVSKKTFILEILGYLLLILSIIIFIYSLQQKVTTAFVLLGIVTFLFLLFGCITGYIYAKIKRINKNYKI